MKFTLTLATVVCGWLSLSLFQLPVYKGIFSIDSGSRLVLDGTSNVNTFSCICQKEFTNLRFHYEWINPLTRTRKFHDTVLFLPIVSLDCGNNRMNRDLQKTLNADRYPNIELQLLQTDERNYNPTLRPSEWGRIDATIAIGINGCSNIYHLTVLATPVDGSRFRIMGSKKLRMTDFGIDPPTAVFGMIRVHDEINISFDMIIQIKKTL